MSENSLNPLPDNQWTYRTARHLLNRAGFGIPRERAAALASMSPGEAVSYFVDYESIPSEFRPPDFLGVPDIDRAALRTMDEAARRVALRKRLDDERPLVLRLRSWWLQRMAETPRPLEEKLALFWHGHFAVSAQKVKFSYANYHLNDTFRKLAASNFKALTLAVGRSPAMLRYLDNGKNVKGNPNENWARELMELFTLGPGHYTERDIKESARAFTGWDAAERGFVFRKNNHDFGEKTFMGRTGNFGGEDIVDIIFEQPATAEFIVRKLWTFFAYEDPEPQLVSELAGLFRDSDYELRPLLTAIFRSEAFYSERAIGSRIKSPVEFVLQAAADLELETPPYAFMGRIAGMLGQNLFFPPNVKGWDGGRAWINANSLLQRYNMPTTLVAANILQSIMPEELSDEPAMTMGATNVSGYVRGLLRDAPRETSAQYLAQLRGASNEERRGIVLEALIDLAPEGTWNAERIFDGLQYDSPESCVDALASRLLSHELSAEQREQLASVLRGPGAGDGSEISRANMFPAVRLLMSLAEYQLS